jgi:uncharacterized protein YcsI (UPF0317 family)
MLRSLAFFDNSCDKVCIFTFSSIFPLVHLFSRCIAGATNGNIGVMKSMMAELTDSTNMAQGFALIPIMWALGVTIGSVLVPLCM